METYDSLLRPLKEKGEREVFISAAFNLYLYDICLINLCYFCGSKYFILILFYVSYLFFTKVLTYIYLVWIFSNQKKCNCYLNPQVGLHLTPTLG